MFDLGARLIGIGLLLFLSGATGFVSFDAAAAAGIAEAVVAFAANHLSQRHLMRPGIAGIIAVAESSIVAYLVAKSGTLPVLGVLVLIPCLVATLQYGARAVYTAPLAAASILGASAIIGQTTPSKAVLLHTCAVLAVGLLLEYRRRSEYDQTMLPATESDIVDLELRETFRKLRDAYKALETASRRDRTSVELAEARSAPAHDVAKRLATRIATLTGARLVMIHTVASYGGSLVVKGVHGDVSMAQGSNSIDIDLRAPVYDLVDRGEAALSALKEDDGRMASLPLIQAGKVVGLLTLSHPNQIRLAEARMIAEDALEEITTIVVDARDREDAGRRLREAEILYDLRSILEGADKDTTLSDRFANELLQMLNADHVGVFAIDGDLANPLAQAGQHVQVLDLMSFAGGPGVGGWLGIDAPELLLHEVRKDLRCSSEQALRARVGSFLIIPLEGDGQVRGYVSAACTTSGALQKEHAETLRIAALELARVLFPSRAAGIMTPAEFHRFIGSRPGHMVLLQPMKRQALEASFGRPAVAHVMRRFTSRLRLRLPQDSALCRRQEGDFLAFLPDVEQAIATRWANEAVAYASMIGLRTPDGAHIVPLSLRARVAPLNQQSNEFLEELTA
jgi:GAF domain-containing protein